MEIARQRAEVVKWLAIILAAYLLITGWNLSRQTIANPDEPRFAAAARTMIRSGDWIVPRFNNRPRLVKPIAFYWQIGAAGAIAEKLGFTIALGFRLGQLAAGLLVAAAVFMLGLRLGGLRVAVLASGLLITCSEYHKISRELVVDMLLTTAVCGAWLFVHAALQRLKSERGALAPLLGFYLCLGLACMTKGPAAVGVYVVVPLLAYLAWSHSLPLLKRAGLWWGAPLAFTIGFWWFAALWRRGENWQQFFMTENMARAIGAKDHQSFIPYLEYFKVLPELFAPWSLLLPMLAWIAWKEWPRVRRAGFSDGAKFILSWLLASFGLVGLSASKRPLYLMPILPALALGAAYLWNIAVLDESRFLPVWRRWPTAVLCIIWGLLCVGGAAFALTAESGSLDNFERASACAALLGLGVLGCLSFIRMAAGQRWPGALFALCGACALILGYENTVTPIREHNADRVAFFQQVKKHLDGRPLVMFGESSNEAVWYLDRCGQRIDDVRAADLKEKFFEAEGMVLLASVQRLEKSPELKAAFAAALQVDATLQRGNDSFVLAIKEPGIGPNPLIFQALSKHGAADAAENEE